MSFPSSSAVKNLPAKQEMGIRSLAVPSLSQEDPLEEGMITHSSILAWRIPMDRRTCWTTVHVVAESDMIERLSTAQHGSSIFNILRHFHILAIPVYISIHSAKCFFLSTSSPI